MVFLVSCAGVLVGTYGCNGEGPCCPTIEEFQSAGFICEEQGFAEVDVELDVVFTERDPDDSTISRSSCKAEAGGLAILRYGGGGLVDPKDDNLSWSDDDSRLSGTFFGVRVEKDNNILVYCMPGEVGCPLVCRCGDRWGDIDCPCRPEADEGNSISGDCALLEIPVRSCSGIGVPGPGEYETPDGGDPPSHK